LLLGGCALQPAYQRPTATVPAAWHNAGEQAALPVAPDRRNWWKALEDPVIDELVVAGLSDNPSLAQARARVDQARAALAQSRAHKLPTIGLEGGASGSAASSNPDQLSASAGVRASWEIDLWGRVRESAAASSHRLTARATDAEAARLAVIADITDTALALHACKRTLILRERDIASRKVELDIARARLGLGAIAPAVVASVESNLASARTDRIAQDETCRYQINALVALSGLDFPAIAHRFSFSRDERTSLEAEPSNDAVTLPLAPPFAPALPATILLHHPAVVAAEREVAARWSEIAVARAVRMPRLDLTALLTGQWLRMMGSDDFLASGTVGTSLTAPLFDGGSGAAGVAGAQAAYRESVAQLAAVMRGAVRDVEDALAAQQSASARMLTTADAARAAETALRADEARWRAGAIARFELEESRRQYIRAQESMISAAADHARAWVALVRRTGPAWETTPLQKIGEQGR
jgi:outer membrane protein, multidrug efflux system